MDQLKVVQIIGAACAGGAEWFAIDLACEMASRGIPVTVLALSSRLDSAGKAMSQRLDAVGAKLHTGPSNKLGIKTVLWCRRMLKEIHPDVVHLHTPNTELAYFLCRVSGVSRSAVIRTLHSTNVEMSPALRWAMIANAARYSVACGKAVCEAGQRLLGQDVLCVANGIRYSWPIQHAEDKLQARQRLGLDTGKKIFVTAGRLSHEKGQDVLVSAWLSGRFDKQHAELHLLGDGATRESLMLQAKSDPSVVFHGVRGDVSEWLLAADWFVMASRYEGLPIAGLEAVGTGLPCVFSDIPPLRELKAAVAEWFPSEKVGELQVLLEKLVAEPVPTVDEPFVQAFRSKHSVSSVVDSYLSFYQLSVTANQKAS